MKECGFMKSQSLIILSALFGLFVIAHEIIVIIRNRRIMICNLFMIMYGLTYGILLSLLLIFYKNGIYYTNGVYMRYDYTEAGIQYSAIWLMSAVVGYVSFKFGSMLRIGNDISQKIIQHKNPFFSYFLYYVYLPDTLYF